MHPRIHVITLAVADLERALGFYRVGLGLESPGVIGTEYAADEVNAAGAVATFAPEGGVILALYPRTELAKDAGVPVGPPKTGEFSLGHTVATRGEVDAILDRARAAGATVLERPRERPWGIYSGYFHDLDGHLWEILHNPGLDLDPA
jgi:catechol 2,3-dioxygenase-like lactoylglutathione lyase family enzyme